MSTIGIIGVTGYAGGHIARIGRERGHEVIGVSRNPPSDRVQGVDYRQGSITDTDVIDHLFADADVVIVAVHAAGEEGEILRPLMPGLLAAAQAHDVRLGVVGGAGSLRTAPDGPRLIDTPEFPEEYKPEAAAHAEVLAALQEADTEADWFYLSPPAVYGAFAPGEQTGSYRTGDDVLLGDADGNSTIGGADFAVAVVDEIDTPAHHRTRFTVAY